MVTFLPAPIDYILIQADLTVVVPGPLERELAEELAAVAIVDSVDSVIKPTHASDWHSLCICSDGSYGVEPGLISSFPIHSNGHDLEIVHGLPINEFSRARIDLTVNELKEEKAMVKELLGS